MVIWKRQLNNYRMRHWRVHVLIFIDEIGRGVDKEIATTHQAPAMDITYHLTAPNIHDS